MKKLCPHCGEELVPETVIEEYPLQCLECDENFYEFEAVIKDE